MIVQLSAGQGPAECELAVAKLYDALKQEFPDIKLVSSHAAKQRNCYTSILFTTEEDLSQLEGTVQWICQSPFRPHHRKDAQRKLKAILDQKEQQAQDRQEHDAWREHMRLVRENPVRVYEGMQFRRRK